MKYLIIAVVSLGLMVSGLFANGEATWNISNHAIAKRCVIAFLLDETGSMQDRKEATISAFNEYIQTLQKRDDAIDFTLLTFNSTGIKTIYDNEYIERIKPLNSDTYNPNNLTPLYDAIAQLIKTTEKRVENTKASVLCVILTDGLENDSKAYNQSEIFKMIKEKEQNGWTFVYLGANQDAWAVGYSIGIYYGNIFEWQDIDTAIFQLTNATTNFLDNNAEQTQEFFQNK